MKPKSRQELLSDELERMLMQLQQDVTIQAVVLFGSMAVNKEGENSDLDMVVIQESAKPFFDRLRALRRQLRPQIAADFLVYTPEEWMQLKRDRPFVQQEIIKKGKVLYARTEHAVA